MINRQTNLSFCEDGGVFLIIFFFLGVEYVYEEVSSATPPSRGGVIDRLTAELCNPEEELLCFLGVRGDDWARKFIINKVTGSFSLPSLALVITFFFYDKSM